MVVLIQGAFSYFMEPLEQLGEEAERSKSKC